MHWQFLYWESGRCQAWYSIHLHINGDGSGGTANSPEGYEQMGLALLATARSEMPKIARQVIQQEKGQNGLLDPNNRRNS
ncbi:hypothetical protein BLX41_14515 [Pseudomonas protegens]|nr:hypothetical protein BLX41_14515 [Pseudomonas protegens]